MKNIAIIWDLDGVLIDSEPYHIEAEIETLKQYGVKLSLSVLKEYLGVKLEDYFSDLVRRLGKNLPLKEMIRKHHSTLDRYYREVFPLTPHAVEVLEQLQHQYLMGIATSRESDLAKLALERFSLLQYFGAVIYGEDVKHGKPDPEPFLKVSALLDVEPESAVVIEDAVSGFDAAKKAGMNVIARKAPHNSDLDFSSADFIIEDLREIPALLDKIKGNDIPDCGFKS